MSQRDETLMTRSRPTRILNLGPWKLKDAERPRLKTTPIVLTVLLVALTIGSGAAGRVIAAPGGPRHEVRRDERRPDPSDPREVESYLDGLIPDQMRDGHAFRTAAEPVDAGYAATRLH